MKNPSLFVITKCINGSLHLIINNLQLKNSINGTKYGQKIETNLLNCYGHIKYELHLA